jgi:hypothetical protein
MSFNTSSCCGYAVSEKAVPILTDYYGRFSSSLPFVELVMLSNMAVELLLYIDNILRDETQASRAPFSFAILRSQTPLQAYLCA